jgi:hypothetical protein
LHEANTCLGEFGKHHLIEQFVLVSDQVVNIGRQLVEQFLCRDFLRSLRRRANLHALLERGYANLEKLVEVGATDTQEAQPLEQRNIGVLRLGEHTFVEFEQAELAVDVEAVHLEIQHGHID